MLRKFSLDSARLRRVQKKGVVARRVRAFWWTFSHKAETHRAVLVRSRRSRLNCGRLITNKIEYDNVNDIRHTTIRAPYELLGPRSTKGRRYEGTSHSQGAHSVVIRDGCVNPSAAYAGLLACALWLAGGIGQYAAAGAERRRRRNSSFNSSRDPSSAAARSVKERTASSSRLVKPHLHEYEYATY